MSAVKASSRSVNVAEVGEARGVEGGGSGDGVREAKIALPPNIAIAEQKRNGRKHDTVAVHVSKFSHLRAVCRHGRGVAGARAGGEGRADGCREAGRVAIFEQRSDEHAVFATRPDRQK